MKEIISEALSVLLKEEFHATRAQLISFCIKFLNFEVNSNRVEDLSICISSVSKEDLTSLSNENNVDRYIIYALLLKEALMGSLQNTVKDLLIEAFKDTESESNLKDLLTSLWSESPIPILKTMLHSTSHTPSAMDVQTPRRLFRQDSTLDYTLSSPKVRTFSLKEVFSSPAIQLKEQCRMLERKLLAKEFELQSLEEDFRVAEEKFLAQEATISNLQKENASSSRKVLSSGETIDEYQLKVSQLEEQIAKQTQEIAGLRKKETQGFDDSFEADGFIDVKQERDDLDFCCGRLSSRIEDLNKRIAYYKQELEEMQTVSIKAELDFKHQRDALVEDYRSSYNAIKEQQLEEMSNLQELYAGSLLKANDLKVEIHQKTTAIREQTDLNASLQEKLNQCLLQNENLNVELSNAKSYVVLVEESKVKISELTDRINEISRNLTDEQFKNQMLSSTLTQINEELCERKSENEDLRKKLSTQAHAYQEAQNFYNELKNKLQDKESCYSELNSHFTDSLKHCQEANEKLVSEKQKTQKTLLQMDEVTKRLQSITQCYIEEQKKCNESVKEVLELQTQLSHLKSENNNLMSQIEMLNNRFNSLSNENNSTVIRLKNTNELLHNHQNLFEHEREKTHSLTIKLDEEIRRSNANTEEKSHLIRSFQHQESLLISRQREIERELANEKAAVTLLTCQLNEENTQMELLRKSIHAEHKRSEQLEIQNNMLLQSKHSLILADKENKSRIEEMKSTISNLQNQLNKHIAAQELNSLSSYQDAETRSLSMGNVSNSSKVVDNLQDSFYSCEENLLKDLPLNMTQESFFSYDEILPLLGTSNETPLAQIKSDDSLGRLSELQRRNSQFPAHLKSSYPVERVTPFDVKEEVFFKKKFDGLQEIANNKRKNENQNEQIFSSPAKVLKCVENKIKSRNRKSVSSNEMGVNIPPAEQFTIPITPKRSKPKKRTSLRLQLKKKTPLKFT